MNKTRILLLLAAILLIVGVYLIFFHEKGGNSNTTENVANVPADSIDADSPLAKRKQQLAAEEAQPKDYVMISVDPKKNLLGETVIEGKITNKATYTTYKDFELMIHWNDEAGQTLDSAVEMVLESLDPGEDVEFKTKRKGPRRSKSIMMKLRDAKVILP
jgi:hypothetical protein